VILFGGGGIGLNLAEKAEKKGLHVARIAAEGPEAEKRAA
jgi:predicted dinucleotide-binding enzyme